MKNKNKKKTSMKMGIIVAILLLAVGFAAVSTVLVINGTIKITPDQADFDDNVVFSYVSVSPAKEESAHQTEGTFATASINTDGKSITFTTQVMKDIGETSILKYKIQNDSQYDAKLGDLTCTPSGGTDDHVTIVAANGQKGQVLHANGDESEEDMVTVTMVKSYVGDENKQISFTCTINVDAQEATTD